MKHARVDIEKLAQRLQQAAKGRQPAEIAAAAKVHPSRITRFLNGEFKKVTPVLRRVCSKLGVPVDEFVRDPDALRMAEELLGPLKRIVGRDPKRIRAAGRLLRSLEELSFRAGDRKAGRGHGA